MAAEMVTFYGPNDSGNAALPTAAGGDRDSAPWPGSAPWRHANPRPDITHRHDLQQFPRQDQASPFLVMSQFELPQWVESGYSFKLHECRQCTTRGNLAHDHVSGTSALHPTPKESVRCRHRSVSQSFRRQLPEGLRLGSHPGLGEVGKKSREFLSFVVPFPEHILRSQSIYL
jgi:hypothetical protein